jgi:hypothetical protein
VRANVNAEQKQAASRNVTATEMSAKAADIKHFKAF